MLKDHVGHGCRLHGRLHRGAADRGQRLRRDGGRRGALHPQLRREAGASRRACPAAGRCALASMGIYVFDADYLYRLLEEDLANPASSHDFGKDMIPRVVADGRAPRTPSACRCIADARTARHPTGATSARSTRSGRPTSTSPRQARTRHLRPRLADLDLPGAAAAGQVRARRQRPARHGGQHLVSGGCIVSGSHVTQLGAVLERAGRIPSAPSTRR